MTWMIKIGAEHNTGLIWPKRCALCDAQESSSNLKAFGDNVIFTTGGFVISKVYSCSVPCCSKCTNKFRKLTIYALVLLLGPWLVFLPLTFSESFLAAIKHNQLALLIVLCVSMCMGVSLFWIKTILSRAVRLTINGGSVTGVVMRRPLFAKETASLNNLELTSVSMFKAW